MWYCTALALLAQPGTAQQVRNPPIVQRSILLCVNVCSVLVNTVIPIEDCIVTIVESRLWSCHRSTVHCNPLQSIVGALAGMLCSCVEREMTGEPVGHSLCGLYHLPCICLILAMLEMLMILVMLEILDLDFGLYSSSVHFVWPAVDLGDVGNISDGDVGLGHLVVVLSLPSR